MQSLDIRELTASAITLTASFVPTTRSIAISSKSSTQFEVSYTPHASSSAASKYLECYIEYSLTKDTEAPTGITDPADANFHAYKEELDDGSGNSTFFIRKFQILSNDTEKVAIFTRPLIVRRARLTVREAGVSSFGTFTARATAQAI